LAQTAQNQGLIAVFATITARQGIAAKMSPRRCDLLCWAVGKLGEQSLAHNRLRVGTAALMLGAAAFALAACGRAGPTELPPPGSPGLGWGFGLPSLGAAPPPDAAPNGIPPGASATPPPGDTASNDVVPGASAQTTAAKTGFDTNGNPVAAPGLKKPFLLDPILR
jgi:hypothetical protein